MHVKIKDNKFFQLRWRVLESCIVLYLIKGGEWEAEGLIRRGSKAFHIKIPQKAWIMLA